VVYCVLKNYGVIELAKVISVINQKGGVGKTTSANAISVCLKHKNYRVLCVDFDPQAYLSFSMGADTRDKGTVYDVLKHTIKAQYAVQKTPIIDILPANGLLTNIEREFTGVGSESILKECLSPLMKIYDYIVIDSPPELGLLLSNTVMASDVVLIPALSEGYSLHGVIQVHETVMRIREALNPGLKLGGMFLVRYYPREALSRITLETARMLADQLDITLLETTIRHSNIISKAMTMLQQDIIDYAPQNKAVQDYIRLVDELLEKGVL